MKTRKKRSYLWYVNINELANIVQKSKTLNEILRCLGVPSQMSNYRILKRRLEEDGIDYSHIPLGRSHSKGLKFLKKKIPLNEILTENSTYCRTHLKRRLIQEGLLENKCDNCGLENKWDGKELTMVLDHINGIFDDNKLKNLRLLCPNCNSQTETFAGRNHKYKKQKYYCTCGKEKVRQSKLCNDCASKFRRKVERPSKEQLAQDISNYTWVAAGKKYGVSHSTARKWARKYGLIV